MQIEQLAMPSDPRVLELIPRLREAFEAANPIAPYAAASPPPELPAHNVTTLPDDLAVVIATSGSTGNPKRAMLGHASLHASITATHARLEGPGQWVLAIPPHHIGGLQVLLRSIVAGLTPSVVDFSTPFAARTFIDALNRLDRPVGSSLPTYTSLVPTQLNRIMGDPHATKRLARLSAVLIGGAPLDRTLRARAHDAGVPIVTTYGMSETAGGCVYDGRPLDGVALRADDDGRVHITSTVVAHGYLGNSVHSRSGFSVTNGTRTFRTDDLGVVDDNGILHITGRIDDLIITGGLKVAPRVVEESARGIVGVLDAVAVGLPDQQWGEIVALAVVLDPDHPPSSERLRTELRGILDSPAAPKVIARIPSIPTRGPGKPDRDAVRELMSCVGE